jgi:ribonuclease PH
VRDYIAAVSVGVVDGDVALDLPYEEDSRAEVDMNFVMTGAGKFVELQATAEQNPFDEAQLATMMTFARKGCEDLIKKQKDVLKQLKLQG